MLIEEKNYDDASVARTCVGRAYYAAFLYVKNRLEQLGFKFPDDHNVHNEVADTLMDNDRKIGSKLQSLRTKRCDSDYHLDVPITKSEAKYLLGISEKIIYDVDSLRRKN